MSYRTTKDTEKTTKTTPDGTTWTHETSHEETVGDHADAVRVVEIAGGVIALGLLLYFAGPAALPLAGKLAPLAFA